VSYSFSYSVLVCWLDSLNCSSFFRDLFQFRELFIQLFRSRLLAGFIELFFFFP